MQELIAAVKAWPIIIQGALGSALFWLVLLLGQKGVQALARKYSHMSKKARISWLISEKARCLASMSEDHDSFATYATVMLYRASRHLLRALMWLVLGLTATTMFSWLGIVGYVGCLYYLFKSYEIVAPADISRDSAERLTQVEIELDKLGA
jgi:hypothetical protein